jgi:hypothetical protein
MSKLIEPGESGQELILRPQRKFDLWFNNNIKLQVLSGNINKILNSIMSVEIISGLRYLEKSGGNYQNQQFRLLKPAIESITLGFLHPDCSLK